ncbi:MAG: hypothetical protein KDA85_04985 [Planctomycetaceae bacterium]|nr:hypothetical protein [Planctomycetaceae bacterium]
MNRLHGELAGFRILTEHRIRPALALRCFFCAVVMPASSRSQRVSTAANRREYHRFRDFAAAGKCRYSPAFVDAADDR